jgi:hypothetical protein
MTGSRWLRWVMVEAASMPRPTPLSSGSRSGLRSGGAGRSPRVALARRLLTLAYYALRDADGW